jgi:DUF971 family protein
MTIHIVVLRDSCDSSECHAFRNEQDAIAVAKQQQSLGIWREIDQYEV